MSVELKLGAPVRKMLAPPLGYFLPFCYRVADSHLLAPPADCYSSAQNQPGCDFIPDRGHVENPLIWHQRGTPKGVGGAAKDSSSFKHKRAFSHTSFEKAGGSRVKGGNTQGSSPSKV